MRTLSVASINQQSPPPPSKLFGGTWEQIKDVFLLSAGTSYKVNSTGGEVSHKLTQNEIPNYLIGFLPLPVASNHSAWNNGGIQGSSQNISNNKMGIAANGSDMVTSGTQWGYNIKMNGGEKVHNNMPPYYTVYTWKRTA